MAGRVDAEWIIHGSRLIPVLRVIYKGEGFVPALQIDTTGLFPDNEGVFTIGLHGNMLDDLITQLEYVRKVYGEQKEK